MRHTVREQNDRSQKRRRNASRLFTESRGQLPARRDEDEEEDTEKTRGQGIEDFSDPEGDEEVGSVYLNYNELGDMDPEAEDFLIWNESELSSDTERTEGADPLHKRYGQPVDDEARPDGEQDTEDPDRR